MSEPSQQRFSIGLIISLCVNLVLAGIIATAGARFFLLPQGPGAGQIGPQGQPPQPPERAQVRQLMSGRFLMHIAPDKKDQIHAILQSHHAKFDQLKQEASAARRAVIAIFEAPNLDKGALDKAFARVQAADAAVEIEAVKMSAEIAAILSPDERKKAAEWHGHAPGPFGGGMMGGHQGDGPRQHDRD